ncbi:MAG: methylated-DNA--[protein]-cysteine S-methyltransferase [Candidatus Dormibacteria bacterium]
MTSSPISGLRPGVLESLRAPHELRAAVLDRTGLGCAYALYDGPVGPVHVGYGPRGLMAIRRADLADDFESWFEAEFHRRVRRAAALPAALSAGLDAALAGQPSPPLDLRHLSEFQRAVLAATATIPRGEVRTYGWVAREAGHPLAVRAAGSALARNPIPFVIPCHRVVRSDWRLGNYSGGGPGAKRAVLAREGLDADLLDELARSGVRYHGTVATGFFCVPSCGGQRAVAAPGKVGFQTAQDAVAAGYVPCAACRPVAAVAA